jgi:hypothetical protein
VPSLWGHVTADLHRPQRQQPINRDSARAGTLQQTGPTNARYGVSGCANSRLVRHE